MFFFFQNTCRRTCSHGSCHRDPQGKKTPIPPKGAKVATDSPKRGNIATDPWLAGWLAGWLTGWLAGWLASVVRPYVLLYVYIYIYIYIYIYMSPKFQVQHWDQVSIDSVCAKRTGRSEVVRQIPTGDRNPQDDCHCSRGVPAL